MFFRFDYTGSVAVEIVRHRIPLALLLELDHDSILGVGGPGTPHIPGLE